jgi:hypothetical protein
MTLATEIGLVKTEIASSLAASLYTAKDLVYVAKAIESLANAETTTGVFETADINSILYVGPNADTFQTAAGLTNPVIIAQTSANDYAQIAFKNTSSGTNASTDIIAYSNNGTDSDGYIDMGITSQNFTDPDFTITGKGDGYIFMVGAAGGTDQGNLVFATGDTGTQNKIIFAAGGLSSDNTQMVITPDENIHIEIATPSTSPTTGALTVVGGVGITGDVNINGAISFGGTGTTVETENLTVSDPLVFVGNTNTGDALDLGLVGKYVTGGNTKYSGVVRDASDGIVKFFTGASTLPTSTVNFSESGLTYSNIQVAGITATSASIGDVSNTELQYLNGVTSAIQTQLDAKSPSASPTFTGTVILPSTTSIGDVDGTEIGYLNGVSSNVQTQLDAKLASATAATTYAPLLQTTTTPTFTSNNYTLIAGDKDKVVLASNSTTAGTVTVPSGVFAEGSVLTIVQTGTGQLTLTASGTTINSNGGKLKLNGQYASCQLICTATNTFLAIGNLVA